MSAHKRPPIPVIVLIVLVFAGLGGWWWWSATRPAPDDGLVLTGQVETTEIALAPAMAGRIVSIDVAEGDRVTEGQTLVRLDTAALDLQVAQAEQGVVAARAAVTNAEDDDDATKADVKAAKARLAQAEAGVELAKVQLGYATVTAPIAGTVVNVVGNAGANAAPGRTVLTMADPSDLFVRVFVPEPRIGEAVVGGTATITTGSGAATYDGTVSFVSDSAEFTPNTIDTPDQRAKLVFAVRIRVDDPTGALKPGMPVDVRLS
ncbi:MAG: efflux RND transporter periplasmic adaptor subunit [Tessaracoccus sp.]|uniref:HlyD family secretion protein n=1 Tax=Tessaracoccus sp. TaxID=1971211 RepID=UPI001EB9EB6E|nr:efflux RND transporter periplasmic adaptor subunit [Tessaracoccus sp.]MBK7819499.1 efflux RND transporter periplasmic adaptor subunit [Tessaracoccus sp.]